MRFSLKWILAAMIYVAIGVAAFARGQWYFADALWALTLLSLVYAIVLTAFSRGRRRVAATGFAAAAAVYLGCLAFVDGPNMPSAHFLMTVGGVNDSMTPNGSAAYYAAGFQRAFTPGPVHAWPFKANFQTACAPGRRRHRRAELRAGGFTGGFDGVSRGWA